MNMARRRTEKSSSGWTSAPRRSAPSSELTDENIDIIGIGSHPSKGCARAWWSTSRPPCTPFSGPSTRPRRWPAPDHPRLHRHRRRPRQELRRPRVVALKDRTRCARPTSPASSSSQDRSTSPSTAKSSTCPQEFIVDDQGGIREPLGMTGARLEAKVHIVTGAVASAQNIVKCANRAGLNVADIVLQPLASRGGAHRGREELGVCLVDIGGGTADIRHLPERQHRAHRGHRARRSTTSPTTSRWACAPRWITPSAIKQKYGCAPHLDGRQAPT